MWLAGTAMLAIAGCGRSESTGSVDAERVTVSAEMARMGDLRDVANAAGLVVPSRAGEFTVIAPAQGRVADLPHGVGSEVDIGDVLVRFEIPSLQQELAALELAVIDASSRVDRASAELAKVEPLFERGLVSRNVYDAAKLELSAAQGAHTHARARVDAARAGESQAVVRASFKGIVTEVLRSVGDAVRPAHDEPILRMVDPSRVQVAVELPIVDLARVVPGQTATVQAIGALEPETAAVASKAEAAAATAPTAEVRLSFTQPTTLALNTPVSVEILLDQRTNVLVVPASAVQRDTLNPFVMVVDDEGVVRRRDVRVGLSTPNTVQIAAGLNAGEHVITSNLLDLNEGMPVVIAQ